jgi:DNA-binding FadR family transcriptional regulator
MKNDFVNHSISKTEQLARLLLDRIVDSDLRPGDSIGTEAEMLAQFKVSRPTLRESIRILESHGVVTLRPGPKGGIIVNQPGVDFVAHALSVFLRLNQVPFVAILRARFAIEPALVRDAALHATDQDLQELQSSIERMEKIGDDDVAFARENREFHGIIARASANPVLETFWGTISILASGEQHGLSYTARNRAHIVKAHRRILEACRRRQPDEAAREMVDHLGELDHLIKTRYRHMVDEPTRIALRPGRRIG